MRFQYSKKTSLRLNMYTALVYTVHRERSKDIFDGFTTAFTKYSITEPLIFITFYYHYDTK